MDQQLFQKSDLFFEVTIERNILPFFNETVAELKD